MTPMPPSEAVEATTRTLVAAAECLSDTERAMLLALTDTDLEALARWLNADLASWQAAAEWNRADLPTPLSTSRAYACGRALWRVLGLRKHGARYQTQKLHAAELKVTEPASHVPPVPGRIMALLDCEPEDRRREALANWARMMAFVP